MKNIQLFKKESLIIAKKLIISKKSFIQISNITRIWHGKINIDVPYFKLCIALAFAMWLFTTQFKFVGFLLMMGSFIVIGYYIYLLNLYTLNFELSSGEVFAFTSMDTDFILKSYEKIKELIKCEENRVENYHINFNSCDIVKGDHNEIVKGDNNEIVKGHNVVVNKGDHNTLSVNQTDNSVNEYTKICNELDNLLKSADVEISKEDQEIVAEIKTALHKKDDSRAKNLVKKLSLNLISIINASSSCITLSTFINGLLN